ncbi:MAG: DUF3048 domain-containing protein [Candidatus Saccharimonadales bacterium]
MERIKRVWQRFTGWTARHHTTAIAINGFLIIVAGGLLAATMLFPPVERDENGVPLPPKQQVAVAQKFYSPLTGVEVPDEGATKRQVTAIMIENSPSARPQSGIKNAGIVFEAIAEGGITRLLCLYQEDRPGLIGPVRSLRPYYVDWLAPFDAAVAHVGGSKNALNEIRNGTYKDIDQFFNGRYYWRATDRAAPHNVYTNFDKLDALNQSKGFTSSKFTGFPRKLDGAVNPPNATAVDITVSSATYNVRYNYDAATNSYVRHLGGAPHKDREGGQVMPKVVIAMKVPMHRGFEDGYREQMTTIGHNQVYIFQDGTVTEGFWRKTDRKDQIQFYDKSGKPVALNPGQTWITVNTPERSVKWQ